MNVIFFTRRFYPDIGGVEKHVLEIGKRLVRKGHMVCVITEESSNLESRVDGINIVRINVGENDWFKKFRIWKSLWNLRNLIKEADVIHCHDVFFWYLPFRLLCFWKPVYITFHGYEGFPIKKRAIFIRKISEKLSWGNICVGEFIKKWYGTKPNYVTYGAVEMANGKWQMANGKKESAVFIGRLDDDTGILTYLNAFGILKKRFPNFEFAVIGDGKHKKLVEEKTKYLELQDNPKKYLHKYHFAFTSGYLSILEAFAAKKLVFSTYSNPLKKDYLFMTPFAKWITIESDPQKLAEKIAYYLNNPKDEQKKINDAHKWVTTQTWEKLTDTYLKLWNLTRI